MEKEKVRKNRPSSVKVGDKETKDMVCEALRDCLGIVSTACKKAGITRQSFYNWYREDEDFRRKVDEVNEYQKDFVETNLLKKIKEGDSTCTIFYLKTKAKDRGYAERFEITGNDGGAINTNVTTTFSDVLTAMAQGRASK